MAVKQVKAVKGDDEPAEASGPDEVEAEMVEGDVPEGAEVEIEDSTDQALTVKKMSGTEMVIAQGATKPPTQEEMEAVGAVILSGDWGKVKTLRDRVLLYTKYCQELGVSPWNSPFALGKLGDGKSKLFQQKGFGEERREQRQISVRILDQHADADLGIYFVHVMGMTPDGRVDEEIGVDAIGKGISLKGNDLGTAMMTALTRAKNRLSNSMCGSGAKEVERLNAMESREVVDKYRAMADLPVALKRIEGEMKVEAPRTTGVAGVAGQATTVPSATRAGVPATAQPGVGIPRAGAPRAGAGTPKAGVTPAAPVVATVVPAQAEPVTAETLIEEPVGVQAQPPEEGAVEGQEDVELPVPPAMATSHPTKPTASAAPQARPAMVRPGMGAAGARAQVLPPMRTPGRGVPPKR